MFFKFPHGLSLLRGLDMDLGSTNPLADLTRMISMLPKNSKGQELAEPHYVCLNHEGKIEVTFNVCKSAGAAGVATLDPKDPKTVGKLRSWGAVPAKPDNPTESGWQKAILTPRRWKVIITDGKVVSVYDGGVEGLQGKRGDE